MGRGDAMRAAGSGRSSAGRGSSREQREAAESSREQQKGSGKWEEQAGRGMSLRRKRDVRAERVREREGAGETGNPCSRGPDARARGCSRRCDDLTLASRAPEMT